jgi:hypothetical protein
MQKRKSIFSGLSFKLDALFFRNLTLLLSAVMIWTGIEHLLSEYFIKYNIFTNSLIVIFIGVILLFIFDSEVENEEARIKRQSEKWIRR